MDWREYKDALRAIARERNPSNPDRLLPDPVRRENAAVNDSKSRRRARRKAKRKARR